jgi:hypothetical protein
MAQPDIHDRTSPRTRRNADTVHVPLRGDGRSGVVPGMSFVQVFFSALSIYIYFHPNPIHCKIASRFRSRTDQQERYVPHTVFLESASPVDVVELSGLKPSTPRPSKQKDQTARMSQAPAPAPKKKKKKPLRDPKSVPGPKVSTRAQSPEEIIQVRLRNGSAHDWILKRLSREINQSIESRDCATSPTRGFGGDYHQ